MASVELDLGAHQLLGRVPRAQPEGDVLRDPHMGKERVVLHHDADPARTRRKVGHVAAAHAEPPGGGAHEARDRAERRRLAGAGRPDQRHDFAGPHGEREVGQHDASLVGDRYSFETDAARIPPRGGGGGRGEGGGGGGRSLIRSIGGRSSRGGLAH